MSLQAITSLPIERVDATVKEVACDGGGTSGHPLIYLPFGNKSKIVCYYCGRRFEKDDPATTSRSSIE